MAEENATVRKIYVLPRELADRIAAFQADKNLPSEVEAVRRLLDEALLHRDSEDSLLLRFAERLKVNAIPSLVARDLLVGHPLIEEIGFPGPDAVSFKMKGFGRFQIDSKGACHKWDDTYGQWVHYDYDPLPF